MDVAKSLETSTESPKFKLWLNYFLDQNNKETYGNAGRSALHAYNTTNLSSAYVIGSENLRKLKTLSSMYLEEKGYGLGKLLDIALSNLEKTQDIRWWDRIMKMCGYQDIQNSLISISISQENKQDEASQKQELVELTKKRLFELRQQA